MLTVMMLEEIVNIFFIDNNILLDKKLYVAFSGGSDSLSLLHVLSKLYKDRVVAVYVNHNIRSKDELDNEVRVNIESCKRLGVPLIIHTLKDGEVELVCKRDRITLEAGARKLRYEFFDSLDGYVLTAHNKDDQIESLFMRLLTGSTLQALIGIRRIRGKYLRPLLTVSKRELEEYCKSNSLSISQDSSNSSLFCLRNRVRHLIIPYLNDEVKETLIRISLKVEDFYSRLKLLSIDDKIVYFTIKYDEFISLSHLERRVNLLSFISKIVSRRVSERELDNIIKRVEKRERISEHDYSIYVSRNEIKLYYPKVYFSKRVKSNTHFLSYVFTESLSDNALAISLDDSLIIRVNEEGDEILLSTGKTKISSILSSYKIPYAFVLQNDKEIVALFSSPFGGKNRIGSNYISVEWKKVKRYDVEVVQNCPLNIE